MFSIMNLFSYAIIMSITPGPNNIVCLALGTHYGYKIAVRYITGVVIGCIAMQFLFLMLESFLRDVLPTLSLLIGYLGAAYLLYLAYKIFKSSSDIKDGKKATKPLGLISGVLLQFINPKAYIFNTTIVTSFIVPMGLSFNQVLLLSLSTAPIFFICCSLWAIFGQSFQVLMKKYRKIVNTVLASILVYLSLTILLHSSSLF